MFNSFAFSNISNTVSPLVSSDYVLSYLMDNLPSPFVYNEIDNCVNFESDHELSILQESLVANQNDNDNDNNNNNSSILTDEASKVDSSKCDDPSLSTKKKRSSNKERHSKIRTAQGLRDRRMRLSLKVAGPFFELQDMLGFDKASKTIEWLLLQSSTAIKELFRSKNYNPEDHDYFEVQSTIKEDKKTTSKVKKSLKCVKKDVFKPKKKMTTKEERKKARDRARERTLKKYQRRGVVTEGENSNESLNKSKLPTAKF